MNESISNFRVVGCYCSYLLYFQQKILLAKTGDPGQTPRSVESGLDLNFLPMSQARLIWVFFHVGGLRRLYDN